MSLTRGKVLTTVKYLLRESNTLNLTYSAAELNNYFYEALKSAVKECRWPELFVTATWPANEKEVFLPDGIIEVLRVYVNGQRIPPATIPELEEDAHRVYDADWTVEDAITIPALASSSDTSLATLGTPDVKYLIRGKVIRITPEPSTAYTIKVDGLFEPSEPADDTEVLNFFAHHSAYLILKTIHYCKLADGKEAIAMNYNQQAYDEAMNMRRWAKTLQGDAETRINPLPYREYWGR